MGLNIDTLMWLMIGICLLVLSGMGYWIYCEQRKFAVEEQEGYEAAMYEMRRGGSDAILYVLVMGDKTESYRRGMMRAVKGYWG